MKDSFWSVDLFRCESITLKSHCVPVFMDQFTRHLIGFAATAGDVDGIALCRMFNKSILGIGIPKHPSTDHDPLFEYHLWKVNLRILDVEEIKAVP
jgi:putative transposase